MYKQTVSMESDYYYSRDLFVMTHLKCKNKRWAESERERTGDSLITLFAIWFAQIKWKKKNT